MSRVCLVAPAATEGKHVSPQLQALVAEEHDVTLLDVDGSCERDPEASYRVVRLPSDDTIPVRARGGGVLAYECYSWLKEQAFDTVHFPDRGGLGFFCLLAKHQGLRFFDTELRLDPCGSTLSLRQAQSEFLHGLSDLELDYMERECAALVQRIEAEPPRTESRESWPSVTVCLTHYNRPALLKEALATIRAQDYANYDVVLVDDGSTEPDAVAYLKELEPEINAAGWKLVRQDNRYLGAARNTAARMAEGEYLLFMDDDNLALPFEISTFVTAAVNSGADILTCLMECFRDSPSSPEYRQLFLGGPWTAGLFHNCFGDANALVRRSTFEETGGFTEDHGVTHEDWEFFAKAVSMGHRLQVVPEVLFRYRLSGESMIRSTSSYRNHQRSLRPYLESAPAPLRDVLPLAQALQFRRSERVELDSNVSFHLGAGSALASVGQSEEATTHLLEALKAAQVAGDPRWLAETMIAVASSLVVLGDAQTADQTLSSAIGLAQGAGNQELAARAELAREQLR